MDAARIQELMFLGLGQAARVLGTDHKVFRPASLIDPIADGTEIMTVKASTPSSYKYDAFEKMSKPELTLVCDATDLAPGDWLVGDRSYFIATIGKAVPIPVIRCNRVVSIVRAEYASIGGQLSAVETVIASQMPVFMLPKSSRASSSKAIGFDSDSAAALPEWRVCVNARTLGSILKNDVLIDELGDRYEFDQVGLSDWGFDCVVRSMKP